MGAYRLQHQRQSLPRHQSPIEKGRGSNRWMVWAPDKQEPERLQVGHCMPTLAQMDFAIRLGRGLNLRVNEGGSWLIAWTDPDHAGIPKRLAMGWVDRDGDMPFTVDNEEGIERLQKCGVDALLSQCFAALMEYREHIKAAEISPKQMIRQRAGEPVRDPTQIIPAEFG